VQNPANLEKSSTGFSLFTLVSVFFVVNSTLQANLPCIQYCRLIYCRIRMIRKGKRRLLLKVPPPDWTSSAIGFWFFNFTLEYLKRLQSSEPLHTKMNPTSCLFGSRFANPVFLLAGALLFDEKNPPKCSSILVWIAGCWNSLLMSPNPKNNWCLSCIFGARFGGKDLCLSTCKPWSKQAGLIYFCMKRHRTLNSNIQDQK
jgi:hypothetical protein